MTNKIQQSFILPDHLGGKRLDQALAAALPEFSRTEIQAWIKNNEITVNGQTMRAKDTVVGGEAIAILANAKPQPLWEAQAIALDIVYEDEEVLVINKPPGMVVHPGAGTIDQTLLNALLHHHPTLNELPRAGIAHRLDKNTSGLLIVGKTSLALKQLIVQFKKREISRTYQAVVMGILTSGGMIDQPIGRHPIQRKQMAVIETGKPAITHYRVLERFRAHTLVQVKLETGRTHQIRVHFLHIQHPILGDPTYNPRLQLPKNASTDLIHELRSFKRQALHACELKIIHPTTQKEMLFKAPLPLDMQNLLSILKKDTPE